MYDLCQIFLYSRWLSILKNAKQLNTSTLKSLNCRQSSFTVTSNFHTKQNTIVQFVSIASFFFRENLSAVKWLM